MDDATDSEVWGWRSFFDQITYFLEDLQRHFGVANESYTHAVCSGTTGSVYSECA